MEPSSGSRYLVLRCAGRQGELPSWIDFYQLPAGAGPDLRRAVRGALASGPLTPHELAMEIASVPRFRHLFRFFDAKDPTTLKPFA